MSLPVLTTANTLPLLAGLSACHQARSFCRTRRVVVPMEAAQHSATLATGSFLSLLSGTWAQTSSADSQRHILAPEMHGVRPPEAWQRVVWPLSPVTTLQRWWMEQLGWQERPSPAHTGRKGSRPRRCCCQEPSPTETWEARSRAWAATPFLPGAATSRTSPQLKCSCSSQSRLSAQTALVASESHGPDPSAGFV